MANHELSIPPVFNSNLRKYETEDEVHADVFNIVENQLIDNDSYLKSHIYTAEQNIKEHKETTDIHVTKAQKDSWTAKAETTEATITEKGLMSSADKTKLNGVATGAEVNQNAFSNIKVESTVVAANGKTATIEFAGGTNVTIVADNATKKVTVNAPSAATTTNGLMTKEDKIKLNNIATNANNYVHPTYVSKANGLYKVTVDGTGHVSATSAVTVTDITELGIAPSNSPAFFNNISMGRKAETTVGENSVALGSNVTASGLHSHAEGYNNTASGDYSHAEGSQTTASNYASHAGGKFNKTMITGGKIGNKVGDVFLIGNGTSSTSCSNAFRVTYAGAVYGLSAFQSSGADYAEYFEWLDGNVENEDRVGYFVTMQGNKIKKAESSQDYILGIVSAQPCIIGNSDEDWLGRWKHDKFGRFLKREVKTPVTEWKEVQVNSDKEDEEPQFELKEVETGEYITGWDYVPNPDYNPKQSYIERKDRKEWSAIGMMGVLAVRDDGTCKVNGFCTVKEGGIATATNNTNEYRIIKRVTETIVKVVFR